MQLKLQRHMCLIDSATCRPIETLYEKKLAWQLGHVCKWFSVLLHYHLACKLIIAACLRVNICLVACLVSHGEEHSAGKFQCRGCGPLTIT